MSDVLNYSSSRVLIISPSSNWNSLQRRALSDAIFLSQKGAQVYIYCLKNSMLDLSAKREGIKVIYYNGRKLKRIIDFKYFSELKNILKENKFDFIHCFSLKYIWMLCLLLKRERSIPLFLTMNKNSKTHFKGVVYRWLLARVDRFFTFSPSSIETISISLDIPKYKVKFSGFGIMDTQNSNDHDLSYKYFLIVGIEDLNSLEYFLNFLITIEDIVQNKMIIFFDETVEVANKVIKIKDIIISMNIVSFVGIRKYSNTSFRENKVFINICNEEVITDYDILAIMAKTLVLAPRTLARSELSRIFYGAISTYSFDSFHSLKQSLDFLKSNEKNLQTRLNTLNLEANFYHGQKNYFELLIKNFIKINRTRFRYRKK